MLRPTIHRDALRRRHICKTCTRARSTADSMCTPNERRCSNAHAHVSRARSTKSTEAFVDGRDHCARSEGRICSGGEKTASIGPEVLPLAVFCYYFCSHAPPQIQSCLNTSANDGGGPNPSPKLFATVICILSSLRRNSQASSSPTRGEEHLLCPRDIECDSSVRPHPTHARVPKRRTHTCSHMREVGSPLPRHPAPMG